MGSVQEFSRTVLKEFRAANALLAGELKQCEEESSIRRTEIARKAGTAEQMATDCWQKIHGKNPDAKNLQTIQISPLIDGTLDSLRDSVASIRQGEQELNRLNNQLGTLQVELQAALALEKQERERLEKLRQQALLKAKSDRKRMIVRRIIIATVAVCVAVVFHFWLLEQTTLSFAFYIDGKPMPSDKAPLVMLDGRQFASGDKLGLGYHHFSVDLDGVEPFRKEFWTFYGKHDLGNVPLLSSKGSLSVHVKPYPAVVILQHEHDVIQQNDSSLTVKNLPTGLYTLLVRRGEYEETFPIAIGRQQLTETNIILNLGSAKLSSAPPDAAFELLGNGRHWQGELPIHIDDVPSGDYRFIARRNGWKIYKDITVNREETTDKAITFPYGSIEVTSEPEGLTISTNDAAIGKTPTILTEVIPGQYSLTVADGENDLTADVTVNPGQTVKHTFDFHYGTAYLSSIPIGASVFRKGHEVGRTPLTLDRIPAESTTIELRLDDYAPTNLTIAALEGQSTNISVKLFSTRFLAAMNEAQRLLDADQLEQSRKAVAAAAGYDPDDPMPAELGKEIDDRAEALKQQQLEAERVAAEQQAQERAQAQAAELWALPQIDPEYVVRDCWNTQAEPLPTESHAEVGAAAVPAYVATEVVAGSINIIASPFKLFSKKPPRFDQNRFGNDYENRVYRYQGRIARIDTNQNLIVFVPSTTAKPDAINTGGGTLNVATGNTSKLTYAVVAHLRDALSSADFSLQPGLEVWMSGKLASLGEADKSISAANKFFFDDCTVYPSDILSR